MYFATGLKGRAKEEQFEDHRALESVYAMDTVQDGRLTRTEVPMRNAMNEVLRDAYVEDCQRGVDRWNRASASHGVPFELRLPSRRFHRQIGIYAGTCFDPEGDAISKEAWDARRDEWLPSEEDQAFVRSLMQEPGFAEADGKLDRAPQARHSGPRHRFRVRPPRGLNPRATRPARTRSAASERRSFRPSGAPSRSGPARAAAPTRSIPGGSWAKKRWP